MEAVKNGWDRSIDHDDIRVKLISAFDQLTHDEKRKDKDRTKRKLCYIVIALIQLGSGCRVSEAIQAFEYFLEHDKKECKVKIAKSEKVHKDGNMIAKPRYRLVQNIDSVNYRPLSRCLQTTFEGIEYPRQAMDNYLNREFQCNTHSLRYSRINYLLYKKKREPTLVAKHVGHVNTNMLTRYTQTIESDKLFED